MDQYGTAWHTTAQRGTAWRQASGTARCCTCRRPLVCHQQLQRRKGQAQQPLPSFLTVAGSLQIEPQLRMQLVRALVQQLAHLQASGGSTA